MAISAVLMIMAAWDLESFSRRLVFASVEDQPQAIKRKHLEQLGLTLGLGLAVSLVSQSIRLAFSFEWAVVLAVVTFIGLGALVRRLRMKER
jgi:hypothetical protein